MTPLARRTTDGAHRTKDGRTTETCYNINLPCEPPTLSAHLIKIQSKSSCNRPDNIFPIICLLETKGQVTFIWIVRTGTKSNIQVLMLSSLHASLVKMWWKNIISTTISQSVGHSRTGNYHANCPKNEVTIIRTTFSLFPIICLSETKGK